MSPGSCRMRVSTPSRTATEDAPAREIISVREGALDASGTALERATVTRVLDEIDRLRSDRDARDGAGDQGPDRVVDGARREPRPDRR